MKKVRRFRFIVGVRMNKLIELVTKEVEVNNWKYYRLELYERDAQRDYLERASRATRMPNTGRQKLD